MRHALLLVACLACTPAEQQIGAQDGSKIAADFAACVVSHRSDQGATPEGIATMCGVAVVPDVLALIADEIAAAKKSPASSP